MKPCLDCGVPRTRENTHPRNGYLYSRCKSCRKEARRVWRKANPMRVILQAKQRSLARLYKITVEEYENMFQAQGGVCKLCDTPPGLRMLSVDHCHKTGRVRALLCHRCNLALGLLKERVDVIQKLERYVSL